MATLSPATSFSCVVFRDVPVLSQRKIASGQLELMLYDQARNRGNPETIVVTENDWRSFSRVMLVPRLHGRRAHVLRNWSEYCQYAEPKE